MSKRRLHPRETAALAWQANTEGDHDGTFRIAPSLYLQMRGHNRSWLMRIVSKGKTSWMGLGAYENVPQEQAEEMVAKYMEVAKTGGDPRRARDEDRLAAGQPVRSSAKAKGPITFREASRRYMAEFDDQWTQAHTMQWLQTLRDYVYSVIGDVPVAQVGVDHVVQVMEPLWRSKHTTARKLRSRIRMILDWAEAMEWRSGDNPTNAKAVDIRLGNGINREVKHREAIPYKQMRGFWQALAQVDSVQGDVTRFMILTAVRASEAIGATWEEVQLGERVWTIPAERMKLPRAHRVPLSDQAMAILEKRRALAGDHPAGLIFPNAKGGLLHRSVPKVLIQKLRGTTETAHGCRSTFAYWSREVAKADPEARELALAHQIGNSTTRAYSRSDLLEPRRELMQDWANYLDGRS